MRYEDLSRSLSVYDTALRLLPRTINKTTVAVILARRRN